MPEEAMLDVSMLAHPSSLRKLAALGSIQPDSLSGLRISATFVARVLSDTEDDDDIRRQISRYFAVSRRAIDLRAIRQFLRNEPSSAHIQLYASERTSWTQNLRRRLLEDVGERDAWAYEILVEEWEFLTTHSWLFAKTRAIYDRMLNAGATALYVTRERLEQAVEAMEEHVHEAGHAILRGSDRVVRRTLKKGLAHRVSPNDRVRTVAKWVAVGGGAATALINPVVGVLGATAGGMFILYDP